MIHIYIHLFLALWNMILLFTIAVLVSILWRLFLWFWLFTEGLSSNFLIFVHIVLEIYFNLFWIHVNIFSPFSRSLIILHLLWHTSFFLLCKLVSSVLFSLFLLLISSLTIRRCLILLLFIVVILLVLLAFFPFLLFLTLLCLLLVNWRWRLVTLILLLLLLAFPNLFYLNFWINYFKFNVWIYTCTLMTKYVTKHPKTY